MKVIILLQNIFIKGIFFLVITVFFSRMSFSQSLSKYYGMSDSNKHTTIVIPSHFNIGGQIYEGSISGMRDYLNTLAISESKKDINTYHKLNSDLLILEKRRNDALWLSIPIGAVGTGLLIYAFTYKDNLEGKGNPGHPNFMKDDESKTRNLYTAISIAVIGSSLLTYLWMTPSRVDLMNFINKHNKIDEINKIDLQLGFVPYKGDFFFFV